MERLGMYGEMELHNLKIKKENTMKIGMDGEPKTMVPSLSIRQIQIVFDTTELQNVQAIFAKNLRDSEGIVIRGQGESVVLNPVPQEVIDAIEVIKSALTSYISTSPDVSPELQALA